MDFDHYQVLSQKTAVYPRNDLGLAYTVLGLNGEAGEVGELIKKMYRDENGRLSDARRSKLKKELGDVLWYVAATACEAELSLTDIAQTNLEKLADRANRGVVKGDGDER